MNQEEFNFFDTIGKDINPDCTPWCGFFLLIITKRKNILTCSVGK